MPACNIFVGFTLFSLLMINLLLQNKILFWLPAYNENLVLLENFKFIMSDTLNNKNSKHNLKIHYHFLGIDNVVVQFNVYSRMINNQLKQNIRVVL